MVIVVPLKISEEEKAGWKEAAENKGRSLNGFVRDLVNAEVKKQARAKVKAGKVK